MNEKGKSAEDDAVQYLEKCKVEIIRRNFRSYYGEIDIIAKEGNVLCFIEVRSRSSRYYGFPQESVNIKKQKKIIKTALYYLQNQEMHYKLSCRFDIIAILKGQKPEWIKNAFMFM